MVLRVAYGSPPNRGEVRNKDNGQGQRQRQRQRQDDSKDKDGRRGQRTRTDDEDGRRGRTTRTDDEDEVGLPLRRCGRTQALTFCFCCQSRIRTPGTRLEDLGSGVHVVLDTAGEGVAGPSLHDAGPAFDAA